MLKFSKANAKTQALKNDSELADYLTDKRKIYSLDLLSGYSCPSAEKCLSKAVVQPDGKRKIKDGKKTEFRCFSASQEVQYTNVYNSRKHNFDLLRNSDYDEMVDLCGNEYIDKMIQGLKHWVAAGQDDHLSWGILHLDKSEAI